MSGKGFAYFFLGFLAGLIVVELTNGKPALKANQEFTQGNPDTGGAEIYPIQDTPQPDTHNIQRNASESNRD